MSEKKPRCSKCGRRLTDPFSIAIGMGPECRGALGKKGWKFPKPRWRVSHGHIILDGMDGKIEPPTVTAVEKDESDEQRNALV